jgi:hypothetical protein
MSKLKKRDPELEKIAKGLEEAYRKMIIFKRQKNSPSGRRPVVVSVDGEVKEIDPYEMPATTTYHRG